MSKKSEVILEILKTCEDKNDFVFNNDLVKKICKKYKSGNPFDATKIDNTSKLPPELIERDYFILHLGKGRHRFVKGLKYGFHKFEEINPEEIFEWKYRRSLLNELDTSEANIISVANNQRIIHDFLYEDIVASPKAYNSRRTKKSISYYVGKEKIETNNLQIEIDLTMEIGGIVTVFEGKNGSPDNFAVYQLFHPYLYYHIMNIEEKLELENITCCYILRKKLKEKSIIRLYNYTFEDVNNLGSIKLLKKAQYNLIWR